MVSAIRNESKSYEKTPPCVTCFSVTMGDNSGNREEISAPNLLPPICAHIKKRPSGPFNANQNLSASGCLPPLDFGVPMTAPIGNSH